MIFWLTVGIISPSFLIRVSFYKRNLQQATYIALSEIFAISHTEWEKLYDSIVRNVRASSTRSGSPSYCYTVLYVSFQALISNSQMLQNTDERKSESWPTLNVIYLL